MGPLTPQSDALTTRPLETTEKVHKTTTFLLVTLSNIFVCTCIMQCRPLTRYLPVRDSSFNLRQFIESSGHCLEDHTSSVQLTATTCQVRDALVIFYQSCPFCVTLSNRTRQLTDPTQPKWEKLDPTQYN